MRKEKDEVQKLQQKGADEMNALIEQVEDMKGKYEAARKEIQDREEGTKSTQAHLDALCKQKDILKSELTHKSKVCEEFEKSVSAL
jgi:chromosome segregation ATPase